MNGGIPVLCSRSGKLRIMRIKIDVLLATVRAWWNATPPPAGSCGWCGAKTPGASWCEGHEKEFDEYEASGMRI